MNLGALDESMFDGVWALRVTTPSVDPIQDLSGNGFDATLVNEDGVELNYEEGGLRFNYDNNEKYIHFDLPLQEGQSTRGGILSDPELFSAQGIWGDLTIAAWVKVDDPDVASWGNQYSTVCAGCGPIYYFAFRDKDGDTILTNSSFDCSDGDHANQVSSEPMAVGQWVHIVFLLDSRQEYRFYINGELVENSTGINHNLCLGHEKEHYSLGALPYHPTHSSRFLGVMREIKLWNYKLTEQEIMGEFYSPRGLLAHYRLEQTHLNGSIFEDLSGNGNSAILVSPDGAKPDYKEHALKMDYADGEQHLYLDLPTVLGNPESYRNSSSLGAATISALVKPNNADELDMLLSGLAPLEYISYGDGRSSTELGALSSALAIGDCDNPVPAVSDYLLADEWTHLSMVLEEEQGYQYYINGVAQVYQDQSNLLFCSRQAVQLGHYAGGSEPGVAFDGLIRDVKIWDRALGGHELGLVGHWKLTEEHVMEVWDNELRIEFIDLSGNRHNARVAAHLGVDRIEDLIFEPDRGALQFNSYANVINHIFLELPTINGGVPRLKHPSYIGRTGNYSLSAVVKVDAVDEWNLICTGCGPQQYTSFGTADAPWIHEEMGCEGGSYSSGEEKVLEANTWTHFVVVKREGERVEFYLNGAIANTEENDTIKLCYYSDDQQYEYRYESYIGRYDHAPIGEFFKRDPSGLLGHNDVFVNGAIEQVKIWNRALSAEDVDAEFRAWSGE